MVIPNEILDLLVPSDSTDEYDLVPLRSMLDDLCDGEEILNAKYRVDNEFLESFQCWTNSYVISLIVTGHEIFFHKAKRNY